MTIEKLIVEIKKCKISDYEPKDREAKKGRGKDERVKDKS